MQEPTWALGKMKIKNDKKIEQTTATLQFAVYKQIAESELVKTLNSQNMMCETLKFSVNEAQR